MSDAMLFGILRMPFDLAMSDEISRHQYWQRGQQAVNEIEKLRAEVERLRAALAFYGNERSYKTATVHMCGHPVGQAVVIDGGKQARDALEDAP